ncbi:hypothetical protein [Nocardioides marmoraquaticus]
MPSLAAPRRHASPVARPPVGLVRPVRLDPEGVTGPTKGQARGSQWSSTDHGWYVPSSAPRDLPEQRILEKSVRLPRAGAVTGWSAGRLLGARYLDGHDRRTTARLPVQLAIGPHRSLPASPDVEVLNHVLLPRDRQERHGIPTVTGVRAAYDAARTARSVTDAVVAIDMMVVAGVCRLDELAAYALEQPQDCARVMRAIALSSPYSLSPPETELRLVLDPTGSELLVNPDVYDVEGRLVAMVDLLDEAAGLVIEVNGAQHGEVASTAADVRRAQVLESLGLEVCIVMGTEVPRARLVRDRVRFALGRASSASAVDRRWYAVPRHLSSRPIF